MPDRPLGLPTWLAACGFVLLAAGAAVAVAMLVAAVREYRRLRGGDVSDP